MTLKDYLNTNDRFAAPAKVLNEPRKKTVRLKSKDEILGDEKGKELGLQPGMKVTLMDSNDRGVIKHVRKDCVEIKFDYGLVVPAGCRGETCVHEQGS